MRIAVVRFSSLGDILCTGPAVRGLRARFPNAEIVYVTNPPYAHIAGALPGVDRVAVVERRGDGFERDARALAAEGPWDKVADLQGSPRSRSLTGLLHAEHHVEDHPPRFRRALLIYARLRVGDYTPVPLRMLRTLAPWGVKDDGGSLALNVPESAVASLRAKHGDVPGNAFVLVPGAKHVTKQWPDRHWVTLAGTLAGRGPLVLVGAPGEIPPKLGEWARGREGVFNLIGETSLLELAEVLHSARVVITGDTGPMHLAVAVGAPLVALFGPTVREFGFYPFRPVRSVLLERKLWCRPCSPHGSARCPLGHHRCLVDIDPGEVAQAVTRLERGVPAPGEAATEEEG